MTEARPAFADALYSALTAADVNLAGAAVQRNLASREQPFLGLLREHENLENDYGAERTIAKCRDLTRGKVLAARPTRTDAKSPSATQLQPRFKASLIFGSPPPRGVGAASGRRNTAPRLRDGGVLGTLRSNEHC